MKVLGITSTAVLSLLLVVAASGWAQEQHEQGQKDKPAQQEVKKAQPEKSAKQAQKPAAKRDKNAKPQEQKAQQPEKNAKPEGKGAQQNTKQAQPEKQAQHASAGRIPDDRFKANFGRQHTFRVTQGDYGNHRFQYGGYSFGFVDAWPSNWLYTQNVYVVEINGVYYLCNPMYPGVNVALSITL